MLASSVVVIQNGLTQSKRRREEEMIWRGNQYVRAIRLYFRKTGHYPQDLQALQKGLPQLHFLRQAYKDPMNTNSDGAWRFIYVNAAGQIIGSTRYASLQQMALIENPSLMGQSQAFPQLGASASSLANQSSAPGAQPSPSQNPPTDQSGQSATGQGPTDQSGAAQPPQPAPPPPQQTSAFGSSGQLGNPILQQKPTGPVDGPVLGAFLTGVGSNVDAPSMKVLHSAKKYKEWEFIWNPLVDQAAAMQQAVGAATQPGLGGGLNPFGGANPFGTSNTFGNGMPQQGTNPPTNPPQSPQ
ncbi:MAG TPA: hypothetical protein VEX69_08740 [Candidatus Limnocylindria bacterium]|nr:hypothetical protein [Candidatus Limnocylindria bacterium]